MKLFLELLPCDIVYFDKNYKDIVVLCSMSSSNSGSEENLTKMEDFNLKTACTLLPVMTGNEEVTK